MEYINSLIYSVTQDPQLSQWVVLGLAAAAGITLALAVSYLLSSVFSPAKAELKKIQSEGIGANTGGGFNQSLEHGLDKVPFIKSSFVGDSDAKRLLIHAGFHSENALKIYNALKLLLLLISIALCTVVLRLFPDLSFILSIYVIALIVGIGYLLPGIILTYLADKRMQSLRKHFPDALDLLVVCCESGLGLLESFQRVSNELKIAHPVLSHELNLVCSKVRVGYSLQEALHEFSERTGLEDIRGLNSVIVQSLKLGTGIASTLRIYAEEYRDKRIQEAEEKAAKLAVKMVFPMIFCIWPAFFIVAVGPAILKVMSVWDVAF
ncbi:type II secretion system F family protein [Thalassotalea sp. PS06]|uniref:type II secretion system F family protein n=1 Tax=Thalassotalea sp. PS06 TaxID=2594005 RepID=UPI0011631B56|nr:type II secretion system F family protein [Thalassotalea sp. PS06]QDP02059.1 type II secretion system F family protein [Thalassotalea sp. PS06]